jgi:hypothetical protein
MRIITDDLLIGCGGLRMASALTSSTLPPRPTTNPRRDMFSFFGAQGTGSHRLREDAGELSDHLTGGFLTDGIELYRSLGAVTHGSCELIGLEDCRTLDVILVTADELRQRGLVPSTRPSPLPPSRDPRRWCSRTTDPTSWPR